MMGLLQRVGVSLIFSLTVLSFSDSVPFHATTAYANDQASRDQRRAENPNDIKDPKVAAESCASLLLEPIPTHWVARMMSEGRANDPMVKRLRDIVQRNGFQNAALNREVILAHNDKYTFELAQGPASNQKQSGRCWIFAGLNMLRSTLIAEGKVPANFEFSESYLHFFNMLEKSNDYLENIVKKMVASGVPTATAKTKLSRRELNTALEPQLSDGGWYEYFMLLVSKYGMVPKEAMPDTKSAESTAILNSELKVQLAETASEMVLLAHRQALLGKRMTVGEYTEAARNVKERGMRGIWKILATHLGDPPANFELRRQGDAKTVKGTRTSKATITTYTPHQFAQDFVGFKPSDYVVVTAYPRRQQNVVYEQKGSAIGPATPGTPTYDLRFLNVGSKRMEELSVAALEGGQAIWFAANVSRDVDNATGIMHPQIYERAPLYNLNVDEKLPNLGPRQQAVFGVTAPNHAMTLTGFDRPDPNGPVIKFKNENSWGDQVGMRGTYALYNEWFHQNVYQVIIHKKFLANAERKLWEGPAEQIAPTGEVF